MGGFLNKLKELRTDKGFVISLLLSLLVLIVFFHQPLFNANSVFFGTDGDGLQNYYTSLFHVYHDKSYLFQEAMNYPYKESVFFTGCQPVITNCIKLLGLEYWTIGILNLAMLISLPISALFLYLILKEFNTHYLVAAIASVSIAYFSPQVVRFTAHYTLAYCFAIPAIIYLMIKFYQHPTIKRSCAIGLLVFFMASTHMYFFLFYTILILSVWTAYFYNHNIGSSFKLFFKNFTIQLILPLLIFQFIIFILNDANDRTKHPWGFFEFMSNWTGVFYPFERYYEYLFKNNNLESIAVTSEGISFVGLGATILTCVIFLKVLRNLLNLDLRNLFKITPFSVLNFLIVFAFASLFYSFGWPFIFGHKEMVYNLGFLQQMRALGRFAWIFFYIINIALIVVLSNLPQRTNRYYFKSILIGFFLFVLSYDAYINIWNYNVKLTNNIPELMDRENKSDQNQWVHGINFSEFQAIIPFPYFHVGSENVSVDPKMNSSRVPFIVSLKSGLPIVAVLSSRVSLSQTFKNLALVLEPNGRLPHIFSDFKNQKDFLVVVQQEMGTTELENRIINLSEKIAEFGSFKLLRLPFKKLENYFRDFDKNKNSQLLSQRQFYFNGISSTDSSGLFLKVNHEYNDGTGFSTPGTIKGTAKNYVTIFNDTLAFISSDSTYIFSFWMNNFTSDLFPRGTLAIEEEENGKVNTLTYTTLRNSFKQLDNNWALIECKIKRQLLGGKLKAVIWNDELVNNEIYEIDDVLIRSSNADIATDLGSDVLINNYIYHRD